MSGFLRRFTAFPTIDVITQIEGVSVVDLVPSNIFVGRTLGKVCLVGEWPRGPLDTPVQSQGDRTIQDTFGGLSLGAVDPLSFSAGAYSNPFSNGNAYCWLKDKAFRSLVLVRADLSLAEGVAIQLTGTPTPLTEDVTIRAGTRVRDASAPNVEFALQHDVVFAAGTDLTVADFTEFDVDTASYSTRTVSGIPVVSTRNTGESAVSDVDSVDATDLFASGIGAGATYPSLALAASTGALDGSTANSAALAPLSSTVIDARYATAIDTTLPGDDVTDNIEIIASARESAAIRTALTQNQIDSSIIGTMRHAVVRAPVGTLPAAAIADPDPGVGANRAEGTWYCYPHYKHLILEIAELDPTESISPSEILVGVDALVAMLASVLPPEENIGQSTTEYRDGGYLWFVRGLEDGLTTTGKPTRFTIDDYISFKSAGIAALRRDNQISEFVIQSESTSVDPLVYPGRITIKRRRMAGYTEDSLATIAKKYSKKLRTAQRVDAYISDSDDFLDLLLSKDDPTRQRIAGYSIDGKSGNTEDLEGSGIYVLKTVVKSLDSMDDIVIQTTFGPTATTVQAVI